ncbi:MAG: TolC family protein [Pseudomonadota bacterium]
MKRVLKALPAALLCLSSACSAQALSVLFERALREEPVYGAAAAARDAAAARTQQAFGALLPQLSLSANSNLNRRDYVTRTAPPTPSLLDRYNSHAQQLNLTQPLWRTANTAGLRQAEAVMQQAEQQLLAAQQDLLSKLASSWFDVLAARDALEYAERQLAVTQHQFDVAQRGADVGSLSLPALVEAQAKHEQALAENLAAANEMHIRQAALEQLVMLPEGLRLASLRDEASELRFAKPRDAETLAQWLHLVEANNPHVRAAQQALASAENELEKQRAGHQATLDLVANYSKNSQAVGGFPGQAGYDIKQNTIGVQFNLPLFSGGTQSGKVDEALALQRKARLDLESARRAAQFASQQAWFNGQAASARAQAGVQGLRAAQSAVQTAERSFVLGLKSPLEHLQALQQLAGAKRDLRKARYEQIGTCFKLRAAAGTLQVDDALAIDRLFTLGDEPAQTPSIAPALRSTEASSAIDRGI